MLAFYLKKPIKLDLVYKKKLTRVNSITQQHSNSFLKYIWRLPEAEIVYPQRLTNV